MLAREVRHHRELGVAVRREAVDGDDHRHAELRDVLDVQREIRQPLLERAEVFGGEVLLVRAAVQLERAHRRDEHRDFRLQVRRTGT